MVPLNLALRDILLFAFFSLNLRLLGELFNCLQFVRL